jgi:hypothetical protein
MDIFLLRKVFVENTILEHVNVSWVHIFTVISRLLSRIGSDSSLDTATALQQQIGDLGEEMQRMTEESGKLFLQKLYRKDLSFYDDEDSNAKFLYFLALQYFRTKRMRRATTEPIAETFSQNGESISHVASFILATNVAFSIHLDRELYRPQLLENASTIPFITGDQPVVNTLAAYDAKKPATQLELFYPLTPSLALRISKEPSLRGQPAIAAQEAQVISYNRVIYRVSNSQVYARESRVLEMLKRA